MRSIGQLENEKQAQTLSDFLLVSGIDNEIEPESKGRWTLWVLDDDDLDQARAHLNEFLLNPGDPRFLKSGDAEKKRRERERLLIEDQKKFKDRSSIWPNSFWHRLGRITLVMMGLSVFLFLLQNTKLNLDWLLISEEFPGRRLIEVRHGQIWRLVTPIFMHGSFLHILFNMWWLKDLGTIIERREGPRVFLMLVLSIAVVSNVAQAVLVHASFYGMSGVVYGLLGYLWMRSKLDPFSGYYLDQSIVIFMGAWYFLCLFGVIGNVANVVHTGGLALGILWGWARSRER